MKRKTALLAVLLAACGGSEATVDGGGDSGNNTVADTGGGGMDSGGGVDAGDIDSGDVDSGGMDAAMDAGGWTVASVPCVVMWLDAAKGVTQMNNAVSAWADQSGKNNNAAQNIANRQPSLVMSGINNLPTIRFSQGQNQQNSNGNMLVVADSMSLQWGTGDFAVWVVARFNNLTNVGYSLNSGLFFGKQNQFSMSPTGVYFAGNFFGGSQTSTAGIYGAVDGTTANGITQSGSYNDNMPRAYSYRRAGTSLEVRVNGMTLSLKQQTGMVNVNAQGLPVRIGGDGDASWRRLNGDISEVIACGGQISMQDLGAIDAYLKSKYAL